MRVSGVRLPTFSNNFFEAMGSILIIFHIYRSGERIIVCFFFVSVGYGLWFHIYMYFFYIFVKCLVCKKPQFEWGTLVTFSSPKFGRV